MKARDIIELADKIASMKGQSKEDKMPRRTRPRMSRRFKHMDDLSVTALIHKKLEEADSLKKLLDDREKAGKKEEKKKLTMDQVMIALVAGYPIIGLLMLWFWK